jgi:type 1 glutamine amidotransferase/glyoxylase-like metal-dependent hydrolase (beta-lactamase superfamily II)
MTCRRLSSSVVIGLLLISGLRNLAADDKQTAKVYGEWKILVKCDKGPEYDSLIKKEGLPLFRQAGGRMVGWWKTLVGNLYEQVTIWEYDDMAAFERAIGILGGEPKFAKFVAQRDPLLAGEENRFLRLTGKAEPPTLAEPAKFVVHEIHRVPLAKADDYRNEMERRGLVLLKQHGFHPVGPFRVEIGRWTEFTYLFRFNSIAERERLIADFAASGDSAEYRRILAESVSEVTTRLLMPAPFAAPTLPQTTSREIRSEFLPHVEAIADGVFAAGFADRYHSANCGWVVEGEAATLVDLPRGIKIVDFLREARRIGGKPIRSVVLTHLEPGDAAIVAQLPRHGVGSIITTPAIRDRLVAGMGKGSTSIQVADARSVLPSGIRLFSADDVMSAGASAVFFPERRVLFAGPLVVNGPRAELPGTDTARWIAALRVLERMDADCVVPGFGSWTGGRMIARQRHFLEELRRQIAFVISQGHSPSAMKREIRLPGDAFVWMPYDTPTVADLNHVYDELTVPAAPFDGRPPSSGHSLPHALVLYADQPHEPAAIVEGLTPVFEATGVVPHFTVDVRALTSENLSKVELLVILRDGLMRPTEDPSRHYEWMTDSQQEAVDRFVRAGGGLLCLHNSLGLYPEHGAYLKLAGGRYLGHGPLERFRVEIVDPAHPITRGIEAFSVADEQHTPSYDAAKVHLLLRNRSDDGKAVAAAGWASEPGRGRLCYLANGHTRESLLHPTYQRLMQNAVQWCLRRESPGSPPRTQAISHAVSSVKTD